MKDPDSPSLDEWPKEPPFGWVQWKGTQACVDLHCECGALCHADEDFLYHVKCAHCGRVYECGGIIKLYPLDHEPKGTVAVKDDDFDDDDDPEPREGYGSVHFHRVCLFCGNEWAGLHCSHDGYQNPCPNCGKRPEVVIDTAGECG